MSCVAFILLAKQASRISGFLRLSGLRDIARILLRFGQIDRDVDRTIFSVSHPFLIFCDTVFPDKDRNDMCEALGANPLVPHLAVA